MMYIKKILVVLFVYFTSFIIFLFSIGSIDNNLVVSYFLLLLLLLLLFSNMFLQDHINIFCPMTLFTIYYFTTVPAGYFLISNNFYKGDYVTTFSREVYSLFNMAILYLIIGYLFTVIGYYFMKKRAEISIKYEALSEISNKVLLPFIILNFFLGVLNFIFNVSIISGGDVIEYLNTMSIRHALDKEIPHTTLFYMNTYLSVYLLIYYLKRRGKNTTVIFLPLSVAVFMLTTTGRVFSTISYVLSILAVYYFINYDQNIKHYNRKYLLLLVTITSSSVLLYVYRVATSVMLNVESTFTVAALTGNFNIIDTLRIIFFETGNIPNIPVLMKIIDSWGNDIGFLYGQSLISWIFNILPSSIRPEGYQPSVMIMKAGWFPDALGAHPPTGIGEMYANFGLFGPIIGMFIFGCFCAVLYNLLQRFNNFWMLVAYSQVLTGFVFLYAKGEFDNLSLWQVLPIAVAYLFLRSSTKILRKMNGLQERSFN